MDKMKAVVCAILYAVVGVIILTASWFVENEEYGLKLYYLITGTIANMWFGNGIVKFYEWLTR